MSSNPASDAAPELEIIEPAEGEMTLVEHLKELQRRVVFCAVFVTAGILLAFVFRGWLLDFLLDPGREAFPDDKEFKLVTFAPFERVTIIFKICFFGGLLMASPFVIYEILAFVLPGLTPKERKILFFSVGPVIVFLLAGMAFAYYIILPASLDFLYNFESEDLESLPQATPYIDFVTRLVFFVGLTFELPVIMAVLAKIGLVRARQLIGFWRYALVLIAIVAAIATPTPDALTMSLVVVPMIALYILGILFAWVLQPRQQAAAA